MHLSFSEQAINEVDSEYRWYSSNNHHAFDCGDNRRSRTTGVSNAYVHTSQLSACFAILDKITDKLKTLSIVDPNKLFIDVGHKNAFVLYLLSGQDLC